MTDALVRFLLARLDEDEQTARAAGGTWWAPPDLPGQVHDSGGINIEAKLPSFAAHIARHDPARVLAEVDGKREILASYAPVADDDGDDYDGYDDGWAHALGVAVRSLALAYANHPDYRQEWKP